MIRYWNKKIFKKNKKTSRFAGARSDVTFLSQPNRLVFLVGSEIQPSSLESELQEERERERGKKIKMKNRKLLEKSRRAALKHACRFKERRDIFKLSALFFFCANDNSFGGEKKRRKRKRNGLHTRPEGHVQENRAGLAKRDE